MKVVLTNDGKYAVLSNRNNVLGIFSSSQKAEEFLNTYSNVKRYSFDSGKVGGQEALKLFRQRQNNK